jgi:uncharacterized membrane protein YuzA (DUF378 family)
MGFRIAPPKALNHFTSVAKTSCLLGIFYFDLPLDILGKRTMLVWLVWT